MQFKSAHNKYTKYYAQRKIIDKIILQIYLTTPRNV